VHDLLQRTKELAVFVVGLGGTVERCWQDVVNTVFSARAKDCISSVLVVALEEILGGADLVFGDGWHIEGLNGCELGNSVDSVIRIPQAAIQSLTYRQNQVGFATTRRSYGKFLLANLTKLNPVLHSPIPFRSLPSDPSIPQFYNSAFF
jgi:hypothetical protein